MPLLYVYFAVSMQVMDADYNVVDCLIQDNKDGTFWCRYMPKRNVKHTVIISYGGVSVPGSPFRVSYSDKLL